jgi:hypothetical protein
MRESQHMPWRLDALSCAGRQIAKSSAGSGLDRISIAERRTVCKGAISPRQCSRFHQRRLGRVVGACMDAERGKPRRLAHRRGAIGVTPLRRSACATTGGSRRRCGPQDCPPTNRSPTSNPAFASARPAWVRATSRSAERPQRDSRGGESKWTLADLITDLEEAQAADKLAQRMNVLEHSAVLVVDERPQNKAFGAPHPDSGSMTNCRRPPQPVRRARSSQRCRCCLRPV